MTTPKAFNKPNHKVSFNDNISTIHDKSDDKTKYDNKSSFVDAKSTGLRQII